MDYDDVEREAFSMDKDYQGGRFVNGEFVYSKKVQKRGTSKDEALYGYDSDEDRAHYKRSRQDDASASLKPMSFVSAGVQKNTEGEPDMMEKTGKDSDGDDDEMPSFAGGSGYSPVRRQEPEPMQVENEMFSWDRAPAPVSTKGIGEFEKHTKGIGSKLLRMMGWDGGGLGSKRQGIAAPVMVAKREKGAGLGAHGDEKGQYIPGVTDKKGSERPQEPKAPKIKEPRSWKLRKQQQEFEKALKSFERQARDEEEKSSGDETERRGRRKKGVEYVTQEEIAAANQQPSKIVDMRGKQQRILSSLSGGLSNRDTTMEDTPSFLPELQHNVRFLVDLAEIDIQNADRQMIVEKDKAAKATRELAILKERLAVESTREDNLREVKEIISVCRERTQPGAESPLTLETLHGVMKVLVNKYNHEFKRYKLSSFALSLAIPLVERALHGWDVLAKPSFGTNTVRAWRSILTAHATFNETEPAFQDSRSSQDDNYAYLVHKTVVPHFFRAVSHWDPVEPEPMIAAIEAWQPVLPPIILSTILTASIFPRLNHRVDNWKPGDGIPIHTWVHPWLPFLSTRMISFYPTIRHKLCVTLQGWDPLQPSKVSALAMLSPWKGIFDPRDFDIVLNRSIVPKLVSLMRDFQVNPQSQVIEPFQEFMRWANVVPTETMVKILDKEFFPKWLHILQVWLSATPNYDEITQWYLGWKSVFAPELANNRRVSALFSEALNLMNQRVTQEQGGVIRSSIHNLSDEMEKEAAKQKAIAEQALAAKAAADMAMENADEKMSFKDVVERFASERGVLFMPKGNFHDGKPVYILGDKQVYLDNGLIYAKGKDGWEPASLETLV